MSSSAFEGMYSNQLHSQWHDIVARGNVISISISNTSSRVPNNYTAVRAYLLTNKLLLLRPKTYPRPISATEFIGWPIAYQELMMSIG